MNGTAPQKTSSGWRIGLFLVMVVVGGIIGVLIYRPNDRGRSVEEGQPDSVGTAEPSVPKLTPEETRQILALKDSAIGHLENGPALVQVEDKPMPGTEVAAGAFAQLVEKLPRERLPVQNLAIARLLLYRDAKEPAEIAKRRTEAREAAQRLVDFDPQSSVAHWIAANVELVPDTANPLGTTDDARQKAVASLQRATQLEPDNAVFSYALFLASMKPRDTLPGVEAMAALSKAYAAAPRNIFVLTEWLLRQAQAEDPSIVETLTAADKVLAPLGAAINRPGRELSQFISQAVEAVKKGDWKTAEARVRVIYNITRPQSVAQSDIVLVDVHPLVYVVYDLSPEFYAANPKPEPVWTDSPSVKLTAAEGGVPALADAQDIRALDCDLNGLPDLIVLQPGKLTIVTRPKVGQPWVEQGTLEVPAGMQRLLAADLDQDRRRSLSAPSPENENNAEAATFDRVLSETASCHDADPDFVLYGEAGVLVVRNDIAVEGDQPKLAAVPNEGLQKLTGVTAALLVDIDHDADLDIVCSSQQGLTVWEAGGKLDYKDITAWSELPPADVPVTSMVAVDWDRDMDIDVVLVEPTGKAVGLLENQRHAEFRWRAFDAAYQGLGPGSSVALLEADGNVSWDLVTAGPNGVYLTLTATPRGGVVNHVRTEKIAEQAQEGVLVWDFDNDGFRDVATWGAGGLGVHRGGPGAHFKSADLLEGALSGAVRVARCADFDRDGDQDLVAATAEGVTLLMNQGGNSNTWLTVYPMGQSDNKGKCNHDAIGSLVELRAGGWYQAQTVESPAVHFGLGDRKVAEQVRIVWTNGVPQDIVDIAGNVAVCEVMILKGSCPYVYTMADGKFRFLTDCLWAAPLGLQTAEGGIAPCRAWEYLRIDGERLTPHEGSYWLQLTEELWEAGYFDKVQLIAVDHPADVEVYTNEKVGPPNVVEHKIYTVRQRRYPRSAVDSRGNDLQELLQQRDGKFVKAFDQRLQQGLVPEHFVELDLGPLTDPQQITLFLTGWILPTDTSLNVAFRQDPEVDGPRMPSVWVPDADGTWKETIGSMGFPGGKTKTIAVDLSRAFLTQDYRVRIQTTAEIYWDEAFFTVDEPAVAIREIPLVLESADLAYRGFSQELPRDENGPRVYDHAQVRRAPVWPPMRGRFTRYGDVLELLAEGDDQMAILAAGDAITMRFAVPDQPVPDGWKRDFILHSIGYDKDADLNTIYGQTVEPLPFRAMQNYPYGPEEPFPDSPAYHEYLRRYQTRETDPCAYWRYLMLRSAP